MRRELGILLILAVAVTAAMPLVNAQPRVTSGSGIHIIDAYYADLDSDGYDDDIKLLVEFDLIALEPQRVDLNIWIELPSGIMFAFRVSVFRAPTDSVLNIDCLDMAIECGWYTVTMLASIMGTGGGKYYIIDQIEFDPPTGSGPGLPPAVVAYF